MEVCAGGWGSQLLHFKGGNGGWPTMGEWNGEDNYQASTLKFRLWHGVIEKMNLHSFNASKMILLPLYIEYGGHHGWSWFSDHDDPQIHQKKVTPGLSIHIKWTALVDFRSICRNLHQFPMPWKHPSPWMKMSMLSSEDRVNFSSTDDVRNSWSKLEGTRLRRLEMVQAHCW